MPTIRGPSDKYRTSSKEGELEVHVDMWFLLISEEFSCLHCYDESEE